MTATINTNELQFVFPNERTAELSTKIEVLANELYSNKAISKYRKAYLEDQLAQNLLAYKGLNAFAYADKRMKQTLESYKGSHKYSGIVFAKCFNFAKRVYGRLDERTNQRIPFLVLFNFIYAQKSTDIVKEHITASNGTNSKVKAGKQRELWKKALAATGYEGEINKFNFCNLNALLVNLKKIGAPQEYLDEAHINHNTNYVQYETIEKEGEETNLTASDNKALEQYKVDQEAVNELLHLIDKVENRARTDKNQKVLKHFTNVITLMSREYVYTHKGDFTAMLLNYLNKDLLKQLEEAGNEDEVAVYAQYIGCKRDTARKTINYVRNYITAA